MKNPKRTNLKHDEQKSLPCSGSSPESELAKLLAIGEAHSYFRKECLTLAMQRVEVADLEFLLSIAKGLKQPMRLETAVDLFVHRKLPSRKAKAD